jgi:hypothetical protein
MPNNNKDEEETFWTTFTEMEKQKYNQFMKREKTSNGWLLYFSNLMRLFTGNLEQLSIDEEASFKLFYLTRSSFYSMQILSMNIIGLLVIIITLSWSGSSILPDSPRFVINANRAVMKNASQWIFYCLICLVFHIILNVNANAFLKYVRLDCHALWTKIGQKTLNLSLIQL